MKKHKAHADIPPMQMEYEFSNGVRGKYAARFKRGTNLVALDPDVAKVFSDSRAVNLALRSLAELARKQIKKAAG